MVVGGLCAGNSPEYRAALELRQSINDLWGVAISLSNVASAYRMQGAYEQALDYSQRASSAL